MSDEKTDESLKYAWMNSSDDDDSMHQAQSELDRGREEDSVTNPVTVSNLDVLVGQRNETFPHAGNAVFRSLVRESVSIYTSSTTLSARAFVIKEIVDKIHNSGGRFLRRHQVHGSWMVMKQEQILDKVGKSIRETCRKQNKKKMRILENRAVGVQTIRSDRRSESVTAPQSTTSRATADVFDQSIPMLPVVDSSQRSLLLLSSYNTGANLSRISPSYQAISVANTYDDALQIRTTATDVEEQKLEPSRRYIPSSSRETTFVQTTFEPTISNLLQDHPLYDTTTTTAAMGPPHNNNEDESSNDQKMPARNPYIDQSIFEAAPPYAAARFQSNDDDDSPSSTGSKDTSTTLEQRNESKTDTDSFLREIEDTLGPLTREDISLDKNINNS